MNRKCNSFDVAEKAGVSQSTVSKALRNDMGVSAEIRKRIWNVATALDHRPDQRTVSLRSRATCRIAVVILCEPDARGAPVNIEGEDYRLPVVLLTLVQRGSCEATLFILSLPD